MKKVSFIAIGLLIAVFLSGHFFIFKVSQIAHQNHFRSYIQNNLQELKKIDIASSELDKDSKRIQWLDNNKEVVIDGQVYDVVYKKTKGNTVSLFVINDKDEKTLIDKYNQFANAVFNDSHPAKQDVVKDFFSLKWFAGTPFELNRSVPFSANIYSGYSTAIAVVSISPETPPPSILS